VLDKSQLCLPIAGSGAGALRAKSGDAHIAAAPRQSELDRARPDDVALFLHTSGTTSRPKGIGYVHIFAHARVYHVPFCVRPCCLCPLA
jgi:long-subunit acyl-CoA synthetase (AMP-forming)